MRLPDALQHPLGAKASVWASSSNGGHRASAQQGGCRPAGTAHSVWPPGGAVLPPSPQAGPGQPVGFTSTTPGDISKDRLEGVMPTPAAARHSGPATPDPAGLDR